MIDLRECSRLLGFTASVKYKNIQALRQPPEDSDSSKASNKNMAGLSHLDSCRRSF